MSNNIVSNYKRNYSLNIICKQINECCDFEDDFIEQMYLTYIKKINKDKFLYQRIVLTRINEEFKLLLKTMLLNKYINVDIELPLKIRKEYDEYHTFANTILWEFVIFKFPKQYDIFNLLIHHPRFNERGLMHYLCANNKKNLLKNILN